MVSVLSTCVPHYIKKKIKLQLTKTKQGETFS